MPLLQLSSPKNRAGNWATRGGAWPVLTLVPEVARGLRHDGRALGGPAIRPRGGPQPILQPAVQLARVPQRKHRRGWLLRGAPRGEQRHRHETSRNASRMESCSPLGETESETSTLAVA